MPNHINIFIFIDRITASENKENTPVSQSTVSFTNSQSDNARSQYVPHVDDSSSDDEEIRYRDPPSKSTDDDEEEEEEEICKSTPFVKLQKHTWIHWLIHCYMYIGNNNWFTVPSCNLL